jgi:putative (di)nucleoside polyphosphate hydrolase
VSLPAARVGAELAVAVGADDVTPEPKPGYRRSVGIFLLNPHRRVFVGQRFDSSRPAWQMPQGGIDPGEDPIEGGLREMEEEIGTRDATMLKASSWWRSYDLPPELAATMWGGRYRGQTQLWVAYRLEGGDAAIRLDGAHPEFSAWRWVDPAALVELAVPFKRAVYRAVVEEFRPLWQDLSGSRS